MRTRLFRRGRGWVAVMGLVLVMVAGVACDRIHVPPPVPVTYEHMTREEFRDFATSLKGVKSASLTSESIRVELDPKAPLKQVTPSVDSLEAKYRSVEIAGTGSDITLVYGLFESRIHYVSASTHESIPREKFPNFKAAHEVVGKKGVKGGKVRYGRTVVAVKQDPYTWLRTEGADIDARIAATNGEENRSARVEVEMNPHDATEKKTVEEIHSQIKKNGGTARVIKTETVVPGGPKFEAVVEADLPGTGAVERIGEAFAKERKDVSAQFTAPDLELSQSARPTSKSHMPWTDPEVTFAMYRKLVKAGINVKHVGLSSPSFDVTLSSSQQLDAALAELSVFPEPPQSTSLEVLHERQSVNEGTSLDLDEWPYFAPLMKHMWDSGFYDFTLTTSVGQAGDFGVDFQPPEGGSALDPQQASAGIKALRGTRYKNTAFIKVNEGNYLAFTSTSCGKARGAYNALSGSNRRPTGAEREFLNEWNRTTC